MNLGVLSFNPSFYTIRRLTEAAKARGHKITSLLVTECYVAIAGSNVELPRVSSRGAALSKIECLIPRISSAAPLFGLSIVREFELAGVPVLNDAQAIATTREKFSALQELSAKGLPIPATVSITNREDLNRAFHLVAGSESDPVIIKLAHGTQGVGVMLAESLRSAQSIVDGLQVFNQQILLQRYLTESAGSDIRVFVVGGKVIAAMRRTASKGEFRSNVHRGASTETINTEPAIEQLAIKAAQALNLSVAGVDLMEGREGMLILEVNASPGLEGIEGATKVDVAGAIIDYAVNQVNHR